MTKNWQNRRKRLVADICGQDKDLAAYRDADADVIDGTVRGRSPHSSRVQRDAGARVVFNIPAVHVRDFCQAGYQNRYDLGSKLCVAEYGKAPKRDQIDRTLATVSGAKGENLYYGAAELNGAGVRYYGDICLVLKPAFVEPDTLVLDRNSFDLMRSPIVDHIHSDADAVTEVEELKGSWSDDIADMAVCKVLGEQPRQRRLITTGKISEGLLADEDYVEVVREGSFAWKDLAEARIAAADAGADGRVADRLSVGPIPHLTELLWRQRRRSAERELAACKVEVRTVVTSGRMR